MSYSSGISVKSNRRMLWIGFLTLTSVFCIANSQQGQNFYFAGNDNRQQSRFIPFQQSQFPTAQQTFASYFPQTNAGPFLPFRSPNYHLEDSNAVGSSQKFQSREPFNAASSFLPSQNTNTVASDPRFDSLISSPGALGSNSDDYAETSYSDIVPDVPSQRFNAVGQDRQEFRNSQIARFPAVAISEVTRTQDNPSNRNILQTHSFNVHHTSHPPRHFEELPALQNNRWRSQTISEPENFNYRARNVPFSQYSSLRPPLADSVTDDVFHKFNNRFSTKEQTFIVNTQRPDVVEIPEAQLESDSTIPQYVAHDSYFPVSNQHRESKLAKSNNVNSPRNSNNNNSNKNTNNKGNSNILPTTYSPSILLENRMRNTVVSTTDSNNDIVTTLRYHNGARLSSETRVRNKHNRPTNEADKKSTKSSTNKMKTGTITRATSSTTAEENVNFDVVTMSQDHLFVSEDNFKGFIDSSVIDSTETPTTEDLKDMLEGATVAAIPVSHAPVKKKVLPQIDPKSILTTEDHVRETETEHNQKTATLKTSDLPTTSTEGWIIVASVQTSRSVSGARFIPSSAIKQEQHPLPLDVKSIKDAKMQLSNKTEDSVRSDSGISSKTTVLKTNVTTTAKTSSTLSTESIIDKLDQVQSELSSGILNAFPSQEKHALDLPGVSLSAKLTDDATESPASKESFTRRSVPSTKPTTKIKTADRNKSLFDSVEFDDLTGLLPSGFKVRGFSPKSSSSSSPKTTSDAYSSSTGTTVSSTITASSTEKANRKDSKSKSVSLSSLKHKIKFDDVSFFLPPGYKPLPEESSAAESSAEKNESEIQKSTSMTVTSTPTPDEASDILSKARPVDISVFLPPGFKLETTTDSSSKLQSVLNKVQFKEVNDLIPPNYSPEPPKNTTELEGSGSKVVFPSRPGGNKKPLLSTSQTLKSNTTFSKSSSGAIASKPGLSLLPHQIPAIKKGWPTRATTEFAGWSTASPSPISVEKLLQVAKEAAVRETSSETASSTSSTTSTTPSTTTRRVTTPGICSHDCELAGSLKLVGGIKWVPELLDHNTKEWKMLADDVQHQLEIIFQTSEVLSRWYQRIRIDGFSEGSVIVDYVVELSDLGRTVNTADMKRLLHETLVQEMVTSDSFISSNNSDYRQIRLGKYTIDPASTDFIVLPKSVMPAVRMTEQEAWVPQWAIAVIVIGLASLCFVIIFGITVIISKRKNSKKHPIALTEEMLNELNKSHMGAGFENYGADDLYNMEDVWNEKPFKNNKRSSYYQESSMPNIYDSWRSDWNGYYGNSFYTGSVRSGYSRRRSDYDTNF